MFYRFGYRRYFYNGVIPGIGGEGGDVVGMVGLRCFKAFFDVNVLMNNG